MNTFSRSKLIGLSMLLAAGLVACDKPGPAETAGQKIDETAEKAGEKIGETIDKLEQKSDKAGIAMNDAEITAKVKAAIFAEPGLKTLQISVDTVGAVVTLSGSVDTQRHHDRAMELASAVADVKAVENRLMVE
jgi:osmotically-inducible protein OsmY